MTNSPLDLFQHTYIDNSAKKTLFLLHGTGGDETDLLPLVEKLTEYNWLGLRGNVSENGLNRFFERYESGSFNQENIHQEAQKLHQFVTTWQAEHDLQSSDAAFLGYSNGANMIIATAQLFPNLIQQAAVLHPMLVLDPIPEVELKQSRFLVTCGTNDLLITPEQSRTAIQKLKNSGASVEVLEHVGGHQIRLEEVVALERFFDAS